MSETDDNLEDELRGLLRRVLSEQMDGLTNEVNKLSGEVSKLATICKNVLNLPKKIESIVADAHEVLAAQSKAETDALKASVASVAEAVRQQLERVHGAVAGTHAAVKAEAQEVRQKLVDAREALAAQAKAEAATLRGSVNKGAELLEQQVGRMHGALAGSFTTVSVQAQDIQQGLVDARAELVAQSKTQGEAFTATVIRKIDTLGLSINAVQQRAEERNTALNNDTVRLSQVVEQANTRMQIRLGELDRKIGLLKGLSLLVVIILAAAVASAGAIFLRGAAGHFGI